MYLILGSYKYFGFVVAKKLKLHTYFRLSYLVLVITHSLRIIADTNISQVIPSGVILTVTC